MFNIKICKLDAGGKPSTWFPPEEPVEHIYIESSCISEFISKFYVILLHIRCLTYSDSSYSSSYDQITDDISIIVEKVPTWPGLF